MFKVTGEVELTIKLSDEQTLELTKEFLIKKYGFHRVYSYDIKHLWIKSGHIMQSVPYYHNSTKDLIVIKNATKEQIAALTILQDKSNGD